MGKPQTYGQYQKALKPHLWKAPKGYTGKMYNNHTIVAKKHNKSTLVERSNWLTVTVDSPVGMVFAKFKHYELGDLEMALLPLSATYESLRYAWETIQAISAGDVIDERDYESVLEEAVEAHWNTLTDGEKADLLLAAGIMLPMHSTMSITDLNEDEYNTLAINLLGGGVLE